MKLFIDTANKKIALAIIDDENKVVSFSFNNVENSVVEQSLFLINSFIVKTSRSAHAHRKTIMGLDYLPPSCNESQVQTCLPGSRFLLLNA